MEEVVFRHDVHFGNALDAPNKAKISELFTTNEGLDVGSSGMQGWRLEMEDSHVTRDMPSRTDHTFLAVFDGHGGADSASFAAANLMNIIEKTSHWLNYIKKGASDISLLGRALSQAFIDMDDLLREKQIDDTRNLSGCTCIAAMITPKYIVCANIGDSRCVIGTNKLAKAMSEDHKPDNELEQRRIELAGGTVQWKRVDGDLGVARAFGDFRFKNRSDLGPTEQKISCEADITVHERNELDELLLLACDGLWDVMTNVEAVATVRGIFARGLCPMTDVTNEILDLALQKGSKDNISAILVRLPGAHHGVSVKLKSCMP